MMAPNQVMSPILVKNGYCILHHHHGCYHQSKEANDKFRKNAIKEMLIITMREINYAPIAWYIKLIIKKIYYQKENISNSKRTQCHLIVIQKTNYKLWRWLRDENQKSSEMRIYQKKWLCIHTHLYMNIYLQSRYIYISFLERVRVLLKNETNYYTTNN